MILNYLLAFSLLVMSVVKTAGIFKKSNSDLTRTQNEFIKETKKKHNSGSISLAGCVFALMFSLILLFFALKLRIELQEARYRRDSYLCMHYLNTKTENYVRDIGKLNITLRSAFAASLLSPKAIPVFKALGYARDALHLNWIRKISTYRYCTKEMALLYLHNPPFDKKAGGLLLKTNMDGTTSIRKEKWQITIMKNPSGIRLKKSFCLRSSWELEGAFFPAIRIKTEELGNAGVSKLKCLSGLASSL